MHVIDERRLPSSGGCILYDAARVRKADGSLFDLASWSAKGDVQQFAGGRGTVAVIRHDDQQWVLRHYRRGGIMANVSADRYWWTGEERTRSLLEWRLLAKLYNWGLPVPAPVAARYVRRRWTYTADLITELVPNVTTLAQVLVSSGVDAERWRDIGSTIAAFHARGVHHADLNANNVLLTLRDRAASPTIAARSVYLLDFDRGRIRERGSWEQDVLRRLRHSLEKISIQAGISFDETQWEWMKEGYEKGGS